MIIRRIAVRNIRSYNDGSETTLEFPDGVVLLEGDIGSGKSTLLYALEFALFGFSDMKGAHLLSEGRKEGRVTVAFEVEGRRYEVSRGLRSRRDDVSQDECLISVDGAETRMSASDLKERLVSILGFNEPTHPRAESLVYRFAVFTPQEQMKEILGQKADDRLHVIRRVLGAQSYQTAAENSTIVEKALGRMSYGLQKSSEDLAEKKVDLEMRLKAIAALDANMPSLEAEESAAASAIEKLERRWKELLERRDEYGRAAAAAGLLRKGIAELEKRLSQDEASLRQLRARLEEEILPAIREFESLEAPRRSLDELEDAREGALRSVSKLTAMKEDRERDLGEARDLIAKGVCPTCGQTLPADFERKSAHLEEELATLDGSISAESTKAKELGDLVGRARRFEEAKRESARNDRERKLAERSISGIEKGIAEARESISDKEVELKEASKQDEAIAALSKEIDEHESALKDARSRRDEARDELRKARTEREDAARELEKTTREVAKKERDAGEAMRLGRYQNWLSAFFRPTVELIERQTLSQAASRFNDHFQRFFATLVDEPGMTVRVKEDFSPVFEREGFEQDFEALSGGERTSMALAYRFSLNAVVSESSFAQQELIILDEPTDGFSREQVYKMRGLLEELGSRQVILVSHERELESMADHIFRVEKKNGTSTVSKLPY